MGSFFYWLYAVGYQLFTSPWRRRTGKGMKTRNCGIFSQEYPVLQDGKLRKAAGLNITE